MENSLSNVNVDNDVKKIKPNKYKENQIFKKLNQQKYLQAMVLPGIVWMIIFCFIPMYGIIIAFKEYNITSSIGAAPWVGLQHFKDFFTDEKFALVMKNTIGISVLKLVINFPIPIIFALFLNELKNLRFKKTVQTISYLPHFLSWVVLGGIMTTWLSDTGLINDIVKALGISKEPISFLGEPKYFWGLAVVTDLWKELGWSAIIYIAAIAGIDPELYEAATVDGAGRLRMMWNITLPCIKGTIAILFILAVSNVLNANFDQIFVLKNQLNAPSSEVLDIYAYRVGMQSARFSFSTAISLFKSVVALVLLLAANFTTKKLNGSSLY
jgi:putative aldouronate transport system permease protein